MNLEKILYLGPWLVALAPAWFVYDSLVSRLNVPIWMAAPIAAGIELLGAGSFRVALRLFSWNRTKRKSDPSAPARLGLAFVIIYLIAGIVLTAVLKQDWTLALFFVLAGTGYATIALNLDQDRRESEIREAKNAAKPARKAAAKQPQQAPQNPAEPAQNDPYKWVTEGEKCGIYYIKNTANNRVYVGSSVDVDRRIEQHFKKLRRGNHINSALQVDFDTFGEEIFATEFVERTDKRNTMSVEQEHINKFSSEVLYNINEKSDRPNKNKRSPKRQWRTQAAEILRENADISGAELGRMIGASERTGQNILHELRNGK